MDGKAGKLHRLDTKKIKITEKTKPTQNIVPMNSLSFLEQPPNFVFTSKIALFLTIQVSQYKINCNCYLK